MSSPVPVVPAPEPLRVLVVDDNASLLRFLVSAFSANGCTVSQAAAAEQALALITAEPFDLVVSDIKMPGLSGPKLWERLLAARSPMVNRIAFVTGDTVDPDTQRFLEETRRPVLTKPFELVDLASLLTPGP